MLASTITQGTDPNDDESCFRYDEKIDKLFLRRHKQAWLFAGQRDLTHQDWHCTHDYDGLSQREPLVGEHISQSSPKNAATLWCVSIKQPEKQNSCTSRTFVATPLRVSQCIAKRVTSFFAQQTLAEMWQTGEKPENETCPFWSVPFLSTQY